MFNVSVLVAFVWDGQIDWYEAVVLGVLYVLYFIIMFNSMRMFRIYDRMVARYFKKNTEGTVLIIYQHKYSRYANMFQP